MKTIKTQINEIYNEIMEDNFRDFSKRKFRREYLGSLVINYYDKNNKLIMEVYKSKNGAKFYLNNTCYFLQDIDGISIIYNEYGKAISITYTDGYEWTGETFVSQEAILEENKFRLQFLDFMNNYRVSKDLKEYYVKVMELLENYDNTTFICDMNEEYNKLINIKNYLEHCLYGDINYYFDSQLKNITNVSNELEHYNGKEIEKEDAVKNLKEYYKWVKNLKKLNVNKLNSDDSFLKIIKEFEIQYNKMIKNVNNSQSDWDLIEYYHDEILEMVDNRDELTSELIKPNKEVKIEMVDLSDVPERNQIELIDLSIKAPKKKHKFFQKLTKREKADYLTWKSLNEFGLDSYQFDADTITVKNAKKNLRKFTKRQKSYEKLIEEDARKELGNVNYAIYNTIKGAKEDLVNTRIEDEKVSDEVFEDVLKQNYDQKVYEERQKYLKNSASKIKKIKNALANISDEALVKIENNYKKVQRKIFGLKIGALAGVLAITSLGALSHKPKDLNKNNNIAYSDEVIDIFDADNQEINSEDILVGLGSDYEISDSHSPEKVLVGYGADSLIEAEVVAESEIETESETEAVVETEMMSEFTTEYSTDIVEENESEKIALESEFNEDNVLETYKLVEEPESSLKDEPLKDVEEIEIIEEEKTTRLNDIEDERGLLETYKAELQSLESSLPQSNITFDNIRNIGSEINVNIDAELQNDEYSLILDKEANISIHGDKLPRVICSVVMTDGTRGITAKTMEEVESLVNQGYYVAGYGVLNPYSKDISNIEGFFADEDVYGLVRK